jgi:hypothetical protein
MGGFKSIALGRQKCTRRQSYICLSFIPSYVSSSLGAVVRIIFSIEIFRFEASRYLSTMNKTEDAVGFIQTAVEINPSK